MIGLAAVEDGAGLALVVFSCLEVAFIHALIINLCKYPNGLKHIYIYFSINQVLIRK